MMGIYLGLAANAMGKSKYTYLPPENVRVPADFFGFSLDPAWTPATSEMSEQAHAASWDTLHEAHNSLQSAGPVLQETNCCDV